MVLAIGEGWHLNKDADMQPWDKISGEQKYVISNIRYFLSEGEAIKVIYPNLVINHENATQRAFLSISNKDVDQCSSKIKQLNDNEVVSLISKYYLCEVDDPKGILQKKSYRRYFTSI